jgi:hypothetical protein
MAAVDAPEPGVDAQIVTPVTTFDKAATFAGPAFACPLREEYHEVFLTCTPLLIPIVDMVLEMTCVNVSSNLRLDNDDSVASTGKALSIWSDRRCEHHFRPGLLVTASSVSRELTHVLAVCPPTADPVYPVINCIWRVGISTDEVPERLRLINVSRLIGLKSFCLILNRSDGDYYDDDDEPGRHLLMVQPASSPEDEDPPEWITFDLSLDAARVAERWFWDAPDGPLLCRCPQTWTHRQAIGHNLPMYVDLPNHPTFRARVMREHRSLFSLADPAQPLTDAGPSQTSRKRKACDL